MQARGDARRVHLLGERASAKIWKNKIQRLPLDSDSFAACFLSLLPLSRLPDFCGLHHFPKTCNCVKRNTDDGIRRGDHPAIQERHVPFIPQVGLEDANVTLDGSSKSRER